MKNVNKTIDLEATKQIYDKIFEKWIVFLDEDGNSQIKMCNFNDEYNNMSNIYYFDNQGNWFYDYKKDIYVDTDKRLLLNLLYLQHRTSFLTDRINRISKDKIRVTSNPISKGNSWIKKEFIENKELAREREATILELTQENEMLKNIDIALSAKIIKLEKDKDTCNGNLQVYKKLVKDNKATILGYERELEWFHVKEEYQINKTSQETDNIED